MAKKAQKGYWYSIMTNAKMQNINKYECSCCHITTRKPTKRCPKCNTDMTDDDGEIDYIFV